jgi:gamma-glutamylcyclotransferase (GGCT)/AIG2-like uncharacterized protein YtfP
MREPQLRNCAPEIGSRALRLHDNFESPAAHPLGEPRKDGYGERMISGLLFVYGTLMRGFDHPMARLLAANAECIGAARTQGRLYLVQSYPGLVLSDDPSDVVHGELFALREPEAMLREFDIYEACGEGFAEPTEYLRRPVAVTISDGSARMAWTYLYNWPIDGLPRIASGRFLEH